MEPKYAIRTTNSELAKKVYEHLKFTGQNKLGFYAERIGTYMTTDSKWGSDVDSKYDWIKEGNYTEITDQEYIDLVIEPKYVKCIDDKQSLRRLTAGRIYEIDKSYQNATRCKIVGSDDKWSNEDEWKKTRFIPITLEEYRKMKPEMKEIKYFRHIGTLYGLKQNHIYEARLDEYGGSVLYRMEGAGYSWVAPDSGNFEEVSEEEYLIQENIKKITMTNKEKLEQLEKEIADLKAKIKEENNSYSYTLKDSKRVKVTKRGVSCSGSTITIQGLRKLILPLYAEGINVTPEKFHFGCASGPDATLEEIKEIIKIADTLED